MSESGQPKNNNGGKRGALKFLATLGVNGGAAVAVVIWTLNYVDARKAEVHELRDRLVAVEAKLETDQAQWMMIQKLHDTVATIEVTPQANTRILNYLLPSANKRSSSAVLHVEIPGVENIPLEEFREDAEFEYQHEQEQLQQRAPMK